MVLRERKYGSLPHRPGGPPDLRPDLVTTAAADPPPPSGTLGRLRQDRDRDRVAGEVEGLQRVPGDGQLLTAEPAQRPRRERERHDAALGKRITTLMQDGSLEAFAGVGISAADSHVMMCGSSNMITDVSAALNARDMKKHRRRDPGHYTTEKYH